LTFAVVVLTLMATVAVVAAANPVAV